MGETTNKLVTITKIIINLIIIIIKIAIIWQTIIIKIKTKIRILIPINNPNNKTISNKINKLKVVYNI